MNAETKLSGPVDVLAVWDEAIAVHEHYFGAGTCHGKSMHAARAAVAELIEATLSAVTEEGMDQGELDRLRTAILNVGPQS